MKIFKYFYILIFLSLNLFACSFHPKKAFIKTFHPQALPPQQPPKKAMPLSKAKQIVPQPTFQKKAQNLNKSQKKSSAGPVVLALPPKVKLTGEKPLKIDMNLEEVDLKDFLDLTFKQTLNLNYVLSPGARAKITAYIRGNFTKQELLDLLSQVLALYDISFVKEGQVFKILHISELARSGGLNFLLLKPRYILTQDLAAVATSLASKGAIVKTIPSSEVLLIVDTPQKLAKFLKLARLIDQDVFRNIHMEIYQPKVLDPEILANYLEKIFNAGPVKEHRLKRILDFIPLKETGNLLILARYLEDLSQVEKWLEELDQGELQENQVFVYPVENGDAEEIAKILQEVFSQEVLSKRKTIVVAEKTRNKRSLKSSAKGAIKGELGEIKIIPDKTNNLLVIKASKEDYEIIKRLLRKIDVVPRQVLIEVVIAEITLNKALEYGVEWYLKSNFKIDTKRYQGRAIWSHEGAVQASLGEVTNFTYALFRGEELRGLLMALDSVSQVRILSSPIILATDNKEAYIQVGQEVPVIKQQVVNTSASQPNITSSVEYKDTGIILKVKPHINSSGLVKLQIEQEVSSAQKNFLGLNSPLISKRKLTTSLVVENNQTILLGGLIDQHREISHSGIPLLKDLPLIGNVFSWKTRSTDRTELLVAITPRVIRNRAEAQKLMKEFNQKIEELKRRLSEE